ncbi:MAG TPA: sigma-70 family RNA polymerase sigma factor [Thermoanaerobaculia bacterium]|nr:sigma-70 family RNA polymerase sigma factor [Thermoanaerobaculia bacterium]
MAAKRSPGEDGKLVQEVAQGRPAALTELYRRYGRLLLLQAHKVVGDPGEAEEVLQDVMWRVWKRAAVYDPATASVGTWLGVITRRCAIDRLRQRARRQALTAQLELTEEPVTEPGALDRTLVESSFAPVRRALEELPREQQKIVELTYFREMSQREIAAAIGIPLGTVKSRSKLAMLQLRRSLGASAESWQRRSESAAATASAG